MRWRATIMAALFVGLGLPSAFGETKEEAIVKDMSALTGTWSVVSAERDGVKLTEEQIRGIGLSIDASGSTTVMRGGQIVFQGTIKIDPTKTPKTIDGTQTSEGENKGKTTLSIYELQGDTLKLCSPEPGKDRPKEFSSKRGSGYFLREFKREKK